MPLGTGALLIGRCTIERNRTCPAFPREKSCYSVNHGAGRQMGRKQAIRQLDQKTIDHDFETYDILTNCRQYPKDEAPAAYKDFAEVLASVEQAGLATTVAKLKGRFVIKDSSGADD
jgi:tRNA-splicing ligase RtcB